MTTTGNTAAVVILTRLPRSRGVFDYLIPEGLHLKRGDLVEVPFRGSLRYGVVLRLPKSAWAGAGKLLPVARLMVKQFVPGPLVDALEQTAKGNASSLATLMSLALPQLPKRFTPPELPEVKPHGQTVSRVTDVVCGNLRERVDVALPLIQRALTRKQQVLVLVPEREYVHLWQKLLKDQGVLAQTYTAELTPAQRRKAWLGVRSNQTSVIVGTRVASFLGFARLGGIVADSTENENHLEAEQEPKYDAVQVAEELARASGVSLVRLSPAPRLAHWVAREANRSDWRVTSRVWRADIIDVRRQPVRQLVSDELRSAVGDALKRNWPVALYLNKRGEAGVLQCGDCGHSPSCPTCQRPLALDTTPKLRCYHCGTETAYTLRCPVCKGTNVSGTSFGLESLAQEVQQLFPHASVQAVEGVQGKTRVRPAQILLGNRAILGYLPALEPGLCALVRPDAELRLPEYAAQERIWAVARQLMAASKECYVQTREPDNLLWRSLPIADGKPFYEQQLQERREYRYPPVVTMVRCTVQAASLTEAQHQAHLVASQVRRTFGEQAEVIGPYPDYFIVKRGRFRFHTLVKLPVEAAFSELVAALPDTVRIDVNPRYVLS